jgi:hypothetical protein
MYALWQDIIAVLPTYFSLHAEKAIRQELDKNTQTEAYIIM